MKASKGVTPVMVFVLVLYANNVGEKTYPPHFLSAHVSSHYTVERPVELFHKAWLQTLAWDIRL